MGAGDGERLISKLHAGHSDRWVVLRWETRPAR